MTYKFIAIDIDDTLLNDELVITEGTRAALKAAIDRGVFVTLATGRMFASAKKIAAQLELDVPIITYQGSLVKTLQDNKVFYERVVPYEAGIELYHYCKANELHLQIYIDDVLYVEEDNEKIQDYSKVSNIGYTVDSDFLGRLTKPSIKMLVIDTPERLDRIIPELREKFKDVLHITKSKAHYLEFTHVEGTKGHAIAHLAKQIGCTTAEIIAIGDSTNDREMIELAGLGVAMGNAVPALKEIAQYVAPSNNDEGVKHVIETFILD